MLRLEDLRTIRAFGYAVQLQNDLDDAASAHADDVELQEEVHARIVARYKVRAHAAVGGGISFLDRRVIGRHKAEVRDSVVSDWRDRCRTGRRCVSSMSREKTMVANALKTC